MNALRKSALSLCALFLVLSLLIFGLTFGLFRTFGNPDTLKHALKDSGLYQSIVGDVLQKVQKDQNPGQGQEQIPINDPDVQNVIKTALSPQTLQTQAEGAIDGFYAWAQGKTPRLQFSIQLGDAKKNLADGIAQYVEKKAAALPACPTGTVPSADFDPFNATCLPNGVSPAQIGQQAKDQISGGQFLKEDTISADSLKTGDGKSLEQQLGRVPDAYRQFTWVMYGSGIVAFLMAVAVFFLSVNWRSGIKKLSIILIVIGSLIAVFSMAISFAFGRAEQMLNKDPLQQSALKVAHILANDLRSSWLWYGGTLVVVGVIALLVLRFTRPKVPKALDAKTEEPAGEPAAQTPAEPQPTAKPRPRPVRKLVQ